MQEELTHFYYSSDQADRQGYLCATFADGTKIYYTEVCTGPMEDRPTSYFTWSLVKATSESYEVDFTYRKRTQDQYMIPVRPLTTPIRSIMSPLVLLQSCLDMFTGEETTNETPEVNQIHSFQNQTMFRTKRKFPVRKFRSGHPRR